MLVINLYPKDENGREINIYTLHNVQIADQKYYPGVKLVAFPYGSYNPIRESIMSMPGMISEHQQVSCKSINHREIRPVFFFIYNVDNYYHFLYDTLPYLITYRHLKKTMPELKLLISHANEQQTKLNKFVIEFLELLDICESDLVFADDETIYSTLFFSSSYTHDGLSNTLPRKEVYDLYKELADKVDAVDLPKKIYVSRRSHMHGDYSNIGTNYTSKRMLTNEDILVHFLESKGYTEVFTELMSTKDKIALFKGCTHVVGPIGGGLCNVLFSKPETQLVAIVSPHFLDINSRFCYSFANVKTNYFKHTQHVEKSKYKQFMRVRIKALNVVGEIEKIDHIHNILSVLYSQDIVAGWNSQVQYSHIWVSMDEVEIIDDGLNSAWMMDMTKFKEDMINV